MYAGLHFQGTDIDIDELRRVRPQIITVLDFDINFYINLFLGAEKLNPDVTVVFRVYYDDIMSIPAEEWADVCAASWWNTANHMRGLGGNPEENLLLQYGNELNLAREHGFHDPGPNDSPEYHNEFWQSQGHWSSVEGYMSQNAYLLRCRARIRKIAPEIKCTSSPLAPGHNPSGKPPGYEHTLLVGHYKSSEVINGHAYWERGGAHLDNFYYGKRLIRPADNEPGHLAGLFMLYPEKPKIITEYNSPDGPSDPGYGDQVYQFNLQYKDVPNFLGTTIFLYNTHDDAHRVFAAKGHLDTIDSIVEFNIDHGGKPVTPEPTPISYDRHRVFDDYFKALCTQGGFNPNTAIGQHRAENPDLGVPISGEIDYPPYRVQFFTDGIIWVEIGNWGNIGHAQTEKQLPFS